MINVIAPVFVIGVLIFVHELGHFLTAKLRKVRVEKFSLGFGPELISRKVGDTKYILSLIPLGGYVKMAGDSIDEEREGKPDEYFSKTVKERLGIVFSGPLMNIVLAIVIFAILFNMGLPYVPARIGTVFKDSPAEKAGLKSGDIIEKIDEKPVEDWTGLTRIIQRSPDRLLKLEVARGGEKVEIEVLPKFDGTNKIGLIGITPYCASTLGRVFKNSNAYKAGLREGDEIISVSGRPVSQWNEVIELIEKEEDNDVTLSVLRKREIAAASQPIITENTEELHINLGFERDEKSRAPVLDFYPALPEKKYPLLVSAGKAFSRTFYLIKLFYMGLWQLVSGQVSLKFLGGPLLIAQLAGQEAQMGLSNLFLFIAVISVNLAVLNLLPIPVLDGGHIMFLAIEGVSGRPVSKRKQEIAQQVGIAVLVALMVVVFYNDILRFLGK